MKTATNSTTPVKFKRKVVGDQLAIDKNVLLVRHGPHRGPRLRTSLSRSVLAAMVGSPFQRPRDMDRFLDYAERHQPDLGRRITVWETGSRMPDLNDVGLVFFRLQDPLRERFPECFEEARQIAGMAAGAGVPIVNPPEMLSNSIKSVQSQLWQEAGLPTPTTIPFEDHGALLAIAERINYPAIVRADQQHGCDLIVVANPHEISRLRPDQIVFPGCLVQLIDTRESYRATESRSEYARYFHKKRVWVVGDRVLPTHIFFGNSPLVRCRSCTFSHYKSLNPVRRMLGRYVSHKHVTMDYEFFQSREPNEALLRRAARVLGFDMAAIDYSVFADGQIMLWEANPCFFQEQWPIDILRRQRRTQARHNACNEAICELMRQLLEPPREETHAEGSPHAD